MYVGAEWAFKGFRHVLVGGGNGEGRMVEAAVPGGSLVGWLMYRL